MFGSKPLSRDDLLRFKAFTPEMLELMEGAMKARLNIIVSGGTGAGKGVRSMGLEEAAATCDVLYVTRIQKERFADAAAYEKARGALRIDVPLLQRTKSHAIVMHPLPRVDEIAPEVDADERSAYFRQARNGLDIRMALLDKVLG